ncbi:vWA domain-containing protein [Zavarzinia compransoris]|nr:VWA domain-containing protein [Zavarzinia compransoris]TDP44484.1 Ca-activated chloride channel family protein [Zavarzinia compransoris]
MNRSTSSWRLALIGLGLVAGAVPAPAAEARDKAILVLDASGSMWGQIEGKAKWEIAKEAVAQLVTGWDPKIDLGLTVYGHRTKGDCNDIEDVFAPAPADAGKIKAITGGLSPKGKTPLSAAVRHAAEKLRYTEDKATVILVSDGEETCNLDPCAVAAELEAAGVGFTAHVIGFDIRNDAARQQLQCIAANTGGTYVQANDAASLNAALAEVAAATAAPAPAPAAEPRPAAQPRAAATFKPFLAEGVPLTGTPVYWSLHPDAAGSEDLADAIASDYRNAWTPDAPVAPGTYAVQVQVDGLKVQQTVTITGQKQEVPVVIGAGILTATAVEQAGGAALTGDLTWRLFDTEGNIIGYNYEPEAVFTLKPGDYRVEVARGEAKAGAAVTVKAGERPAVEIVLSAGSLELEVKPSEAEPPASQGVTWKIFREGTEDQVAYSYDGKAVFTLPPGRYTVQVWIGEATASAVVEVKPKETTRTTLVLGAGDVKPRAIFAPGAPKPTRDLSWKVFLIDPKADDRKGAQVTYSFDLEPVFHLNAGRYLLEVTSGVAVVAAEIEVKAGEQARPELNLNAGAVLGKTNAADVSWRLYKVVTAMTGMEKEQVAYAFDPAPVWIVPAGDYILEATAGDKVAEVPVTVIAGKPTQAQVTLP